MTASQAITAVADNLRSHPVAFAIIVINALFLLTATWVLSDVAANERARSADLHKLLTDCIEKQGPRNAR